VNFSRTLIIAFKFSNCYLSNAFVHVTHPPELFIQYLLPCVNLLSRGSYFLIAWFQFKLGFFPLTSNTCFSASSSLIFCLFFKYWILDFDWLWFMSLQLTHLFWYIFYIMCSSQEVLPASAAQQPVLLSHILPFVFVLKPESSICLFELRLKLWFFFFWDSVARLT